MEVRKEIIKFQNARLTEDKTEYLFGVFKKRIITEKITELVEYYKFHNEIPRIF